MLIPVIIIIAFALGFYILLADIEQVFNIIHIVFQFFGNTQAFLGNTQAKTVHVSQFHTILC